ncbi:mannan-binding lectin [Nostoc sphaeroides CHAB 2801]|uniref:mannan-binding lectin n=1 Tax=Nostoc sphaeroides TaxID=446679 RepID=UPI000E4A2C5C|nr:mannan-binding lectin [Nostoc sphaeroides]MCC5628817.1 mannan-binding lectin [Nostoc sphaeroides CHAB 2801]
MFNKLGFLKSFGFFTTTVVSIVFGSVPNALALNVNAGPIWNNDDAQIKCPVVAAVYGTQWTGRWTTTIWNKMSVCDLNLSSLPVIYLPTDVKAGPIWSNNDAQFKCPVAATAANGVWNGGWTTTVWGLMSVCRVDPR